MNSPLIRVAGCACAVLLYGLALQAASPTTSQANRPELTLAPSALFPGKPPGPAEGRIHPRRVELSNRALSLTWSRPSGSLGPLTVRDRQSGRALVLTGEVFQIRLTDGTAYGASRLRPEAEPSLERCAADPRAARWATRLEGRRLVWPLRSSDGRLRVVWRALLGDGSGYARQELELSALAEDLAIQEIVWWDEAIAGARAEGLVDGVPGVVGPFFFGLENPHALNMDTNGQVRCRLRRDATLARGQTLESSFVVGVAPAGQMRRAFLSYLERERAHPYRPFLHYNSWYDTAWSPFALNETNSLEAIRLVGENLVRPHGVRLDAMVFDDGWDNPKTLWQFHRGYPRGFAPLAELCRQYDTRLGVWLSPFGGYGSPKEQRLQFGREQGFEVNDTGFSLAGPKYYEAFRRACVEMIRRYGVNHFKFDGIAAGMYANGSAQYLLDTEAMRRLMIELRREDPHLYINLTTGSWPSPFWLRFADSLWRQGGDMGLAGKGPTQQQWLTYRDQETYRNIVRKSPLYPLNALMTQGVAYSRHGSAGDPTFNSAGFKDDVRAFFGSGTSLQELYIQPGRLTRDDWTVLAEAARWSRANADVLADTHWLGGDPGRLDVYGYASWCPRLGVLSLRNPGDQPREYWVDVGQAFELPPSAPTRYRLRSPWAEAASRGTFDAQAGQPLRFNLAPFEVRVLEAIPLR